MTGNPNATKGIPEHLLTENPSLAKILKMKGKHRNKNVWFNEDKCFDMVFTDDQEKLYSMKMNQQHFVEDYW